MFAPAPAATLHGAITVLAGVMTARIALGPYRALADQPDALFHPPSFLGFLDGMPPAGVIAGLQVAGSVAGLLAVAGRRRRVTFAVAWLMLLVLAGLRASRGKIQHNDVLLLLTAVPFLAATASTRARDDRVGEDYGWPVRAGMVVVAVGYFWSGVAKVLSSGAAWALSDNMSNVLYDAARGPKSHAAALARGIADHGTLARSIAAATLLFELAFPLVLRFVRLRPFAVGGSLLLHGAIFVLLGLDYSAWVGAVTAVFVDWQRVARRYPSVIARSGQFSTPMRA